MFNLIVLFLQATALVYLAGVQARFVCSDEYHDIVRRTPHVRRATSWPRLILGLAVVLFCDGSVRALSGETDAKTVEALLTKDGGETVELPDP